jgi:hypothetical protein
LWYDNNIVEADTSEEQKGGATEKVCSSLQTLIDKPHLFTQKHRDYL